MCGWSWFYSLFSLSLTNPLNRQKQQWVCLTLWLNCPVSGFFIPSKIITFLPDCTHKIFLMCTVTFSNTFFDGSAAFSVVSLLSVGWNLRLKVWKENTWGCVVVRTKNPAPFQAPAELLHVRHLLERGYHVFCSFLLSLLCPFVALHDLQLWKMFFLCWCFRKPLFQPLFEQLSL